MERVKSLQSGFGSCFLELWKRFCPLSEWTLLSETLWRLKTDSTENILSPKRAYFNFLKNIYVSSNMSMVLFLKKAIQFGEKHYDNMLLHAKESFSLASPMFLDFFFQLLYQI